MLNRLLPGQQAWAGITMLMMCLALLMTPRVLASPVTLARDGQARQVVRVAESASQDVRDIAQTLARYLGLISGGSFTLETGDGSEGIAVGLGEDFPALKLAPVLDAQGVAGDEQYLLRSHGDGLYVVGRSALAVRHAVWDLLYRLGHRQFFPGQTWEVIPSSPTLEIDIDALESPDYLTRRIWYGSGLWDYNAEPYRQWQERNRAPGAFSLRTGHAYGAIIRQYKKEFDAHPEYYALVNGKRNGSKMCTSNPGVQAIVRDYARYAIDRYPGTGSISIDPSDGGGWCECEPCAALGTPSDRALLLANVISEYLEAEHPDRYVAMYAYNQHSPPPTKVRARPRVIINVATAFLRDGYTTTRLMDEWRTWGVEHIGIREYYSVWDKDMPSAARGASIPYLKRTIVDFHQRGAKFMTAESRDNWGPNGLGYYLATRMLWDIDEADNLEALREDFIQKAFGQAHQPMRRFYALINGERRQIVSSPMIGQMYRLLHEARQATTDPKVLARLDDLILYTRYVELYQQYAMATGAARQATFEASLQHAYRMRKTMMVHTKSIYRNVDRQRGVTLPDNARWNVPEDKNPWKNSEPWSRQELDDFVTQGIANHPKLTFEPVAFSDELAPASTTLKLASQNALMEQFRTRGKTAYILWFDNAPATLDLEVTGGLIAAYRNRGPVKLRLYEGVEDQATLVSQHDAPNDGQKYPASLQVRHKGLHILTISDGGDLSELIFPAHVKVTSEVSSEHDASFNGRWSGYFYVPKGTKVVGGHLSSRSTTIRDADGKILHRTAERGYFHVDVPEGQDGKVWSARHISGRLTLMTVPPYISRSPQDLLLPVEVVTQDSQ